MSGSNNARVSQVVAQALVKAGNDKIRASQIAVEALIGTLGFVRASQAVAQALIGTLGYVRVSQIVPEALIDTLGFVRVSQIVAEVLVPNIEVPLPVVYPTLIGLGYSVIKRPIWNTSVGAAASGRDARAALQANVLYEWDLTYDYLGDGSNAGASTYASDLKTLLGFFNTVQGGLSTFLFADPDDSSVISQAIGVGDGVTTNFTLTRTYGGGGFETTEPVGYLNQTVAPNVYVAGVLQNPDTYTFVTTNLYAQVLKFTTAPPSGDAITMDFSFYYGVRFKDDTYDFEKFMQQMWSLKKLTLRQTRF